jgi:uncharacterized protein
MIVDAHTHVELSLPGVEDEDANIYGLKGCGLDAYLAQMRQNGVDACYLFPIRGLRDASLIQKENDALAEGRCRFPRKLFPWGTVHPNWPEQKLRGEIRRIARDLNLYGVKLLPILQGFPISGAGMDVLAEEALECGLPVVFHDGSPEYASATQVIYYARKHPELRVLSGHAGLREQWPDFIPAAAELPNLWLCLSGPTQWGIQRLYDGLGPDKLLFGSDAGLGPTSITSAYLRRIDRLDAPPDHKTMILGANALRFLFGDSLTSLEEVTG